MTGPAVHVLARAKVNLHLSVVGVRPDGYHDLEMVMQAVDLADELTLVPAAATEVAFRWADGPGEPAPGRPDLVERAVERYRARAGGEGARVDVRKRIPLASGLAGGSADAAAALAGMDALAGGRLAPELPAMAAALGADVPFALAGGTCLARGRGERLTPVACPVRLWWVLGLSGFGIATPDAFRRHDALGPGEPGRLGDLLAALEAGEPEGVARFLSNDLARAARDLDPRLAPLEAAMREAGALGSVVSGSGPTVVGLCRDEAHARRAAERASAAFERVEVASSARLGAEVVPHRSPAGA